MNQILLFCRATFHFAAVEVIIICTKSAAKYNVILSIQNGPGYTVRLYKTCQHYFSNSRMYQYDQQVNMEITKQTLLLAESLRFIFQIIMRYSRDIRTLIMKIP